MENYLSPENITGIMFVFVLPAFVLLYIVGHIIQFFDNRKKSEIPKKNKTTIIKEVSPDPVYYYEKGCSYKFADEYEKALAYFNKAIELDPNNDYYYYNLGILHDENWEGEKALECFNKAIELNPNNAYYYCQRGHLLNYMEKQKEAKEDMKKAQELS